MAQEVIGHYNPKEFNADTDLLFQSMKFNNNLLNFYLSTIVLK